MYSVLRGQDLQLTLSVCGVVLTTLWGHKSGQTVFGGLVSIWGQNACPHKVIPYNILGFRLDFWLNLGLGM